MNKIKTMALACAALMCGVSASAQFSTGGSSASSSSNEIADYNQIGLSYVNETFSYDYPKAYGDMDNIGLNGIGLKYIHGFSVSKTLPMYVETGLSFNMNFGSQDIKYYDDEDDDYGYKKKYQHFALAVPVNFAYKFNINEDFAVKPYAGLNFKLNLVGRMKDDFGGGYDDDDDWWSAPAISREGYDWDDDYDYEDSDKWLNLYDKKDMGGTQWNRFQMGWQIGAEVQYRKFFLGVEYGTDFIKAQSKKDYGEKFNINSGTLKVSLGFCF